MPSAAEGPEEELPEAIRRVQADRDFIERLERLVEEDREILDRLSKSDD